jgi:hypothetical protein
VSGLATKPLRQFLIGVGLKTDGDGLWVVWPQNHSDGFAGLASKPVATVSDSLASKSVATVSSGLASKPVVTVSSGLASKPAATVSSSLASKPATTVFSNLTSKLVVTVSPGLASKPAVGFLVEPQNQGGEGFSGLGLKTGSSGLVI